MINEVLIPNTPSGVAGCVSRDSVVEAYNTVPNRIGVRIAYKTIRFLLPKQSRVVNWLNKWPCHWSVIDGVEKYGPFPSREGAIEYEHNHLRIPLRRIH